MLKDIILEFDGDSERLKTDDIYDYKGEKDLTTVKSLEAKVDTTEITLSSLGSVFPSLQKLRLNNSIISSVRDIGCYFCHLRFLSLADCGISSLDGISTISPNLEEVYLAFNEITDMSDLLGLNNLRILDLEENNIKNLSDIEILSCCSKLRAITLAGNPCAESEHYREDVRRYIPQLVYLDEKRIVPKKQQAKTPQKQTIAKELDHRKETQVPSTPTPISRPTSSIKFIEKHQNDSVSEKPMTAETQKRESTITEYLEDIIDERPPTSRGDYNHKALESWLKPISKPTTPSKATNTPKITRPVSSCMKTRSNRV